MKPAPARPALLAAAVIAAVAAGVARPRVARAQVDETEHVYVVAPGDTLSRIAARLGVSPVALAERNYLTRPYRLRVGRRLRLPDGVSREGLRLCPTRAQLAAGASGGDGAGGGRGAGEEAAAPSAHRAGFVNLTRQRDGATLSTNFAAAGNLRVRVERFLRYRDGSRHLIHPRLIRQIAALSDHFGGRRIVVLSGFRPHLHDPTAPRSRHSMGYAIDLRIDGVSTRAVYDFCQTLPEMGCGLYPRGGFVHVDVRREASAWVDNSGPRGGSRASEEVEDRVADVLADAAPVDGARGDARAE